jgi:hypothetical protein
MPSGSEEHPWLSQVQRERSMPVAPPYLALDIRPDVALSPQLVEERLRRTLEIWDRARSRDPALQVLDDEVRDYARQAALRLRRLTKPPAETGAATAAVPDRRAEAVAPPPTKPAAPPAPTTPPAVPPGRVRAVVCELLERRLGRGLNASRFVPLQVIDGVRAEALRGGSAATEVDAAVAFWTRGKTLDDLRRSVGQRLQSMVDAAEHQARQAGDALPSRAIYRRQLDEATSEFHEAYALELAFTHEVFDQALREQRVEVTNLVWPADRPKGLLSRISRLLGK